MSFFAEHHSQIEGNDISYSIRFSYTPGGFVQNSYTNTWLTDFIFPYYQSEGMLDLITSICFHLVKLVVWTLAGPRGDNPQDPDQYGNMPGYQSYGFLPIQKAIDLYVDAVVTRIVPLSSDSNASPTLWYVAVSLSSQEMQMQPRLKINILCWPYRQSLRISSLPVSLPFALAYQRTAAATHGLPS
jgi:hypothetical protein